MSGNEYSIKDSLTPIELLGKIAEPILSLVALAILFFFGIDWLLAPIASFLSQFNWFSTVLSIGDSISSIITWLDSLNGTDSPSLPFGLTLPSERVLDLVFTLVELGIGIAVIGNALNASILVVDAEGVTIEGTSVPWSSIQQVELIQPQSSVPEAEQFTIGLRLSPDASLHDNTDMNTVTLSEIESALRTSVDGQQFDPECLAAAVDRFAPKNISLTEIPGESERKEDREIEYEADRWKCMDE